MKEDREEMWQKWRASGSRQDYEALMGSLRPLVESEVQKFVSTSAPPSVLRAEAFRHAARALRTYDPDKGVQLSTWTGQNLRKLSRFAAKFQSAGSIPEARRRQIHTFKRIQSDLSGTAGREPSAQELGVALGWPVSEVARMRRELRGEVLDTVDPVLQELGGQHDADVDVALRYVYPGLPSQDKLVFEHTFGYGGQPTLKTNAEIAAKVGVSETSVRNIKKRIGEQLLPFLE